MSVYSTTIDGTKCEASQTATFRKTLDVTAEYKIGGPIEALELFPSEILSQNFLFGRNLC